MGHPAGYMDMSAHSIVLVDFKFPLKS